MHLCENVFQPHQFHQKTKQTSISNSLPFPTFGTKGVFLGGGSKAVTGSHNTGPAALGAASSARRLREERRPNLDSGTFSGSSGGGVLAGWRRLDAPLSRRRRKSYRELWQPYRFQDYNKNEGNLFYFISLLKSAVTVRIDYAKATQVH